MNNSDRHPGKRFWLLFISLLACIGLFSEGLSQCPGLYEWHEDNIVNSKPISIYVSDLDKDGDDDIAVACYWREFMSLIFNHGDATFTWPIWCVVPFYNEWIDGADLDNDNDDDIIVACSEYHCVSVLLNRGDGTFELRTDYPTYGNSRSVCATDVNGDDYIDLVAANYWNDRISILINRGDGTFEPFYSFLVSSPPRGAWAADLDNDNDNDLFIANYDQNSIAVYQNDGTGSFTFKTNYPVGNKPFMVCPTDINNDNHIDLVSANSGDSTISILRNTGFGGSFAPQVKYIVGHEPVNVHAVDIDEDGDIDLASANSADNTVTTLFNNGSGIYDHNTLDTVGINPYSIAHGDFDGDNHVDLAVATFMTNFVSILLNANVQPFTGNLTGVLTDPQGAPIEDASVSVVGYGEFAVTDSVGRFNIDSLCCRLYDIRISHSDYCDTLLSDIRISPDITTSLDMQLNFRGIGGVVRNPQAESITGIQVEIADLGESTSTDSSGFFYFGCVALGSYDLRFYHPQYTDTVVADVIPSINDTTEIDLTMQPRGYLAGYISDTQMQPVHGIAIISDEGVRDTSNNDGLYILELLNAGAHTISFRSSYYYDTTITNIVIPAGDTAHVDISLTPRPDLEIWYGSLDCRPEQVMIDDQVAVDVFIRTAGPIQIEQARLILGGDNQYISQFESEVYGELLYPFSDMQTGVFSQTIGNPPNPAGWSSQYLEVSGTMAQSPWFDFYVPTIAARFVVKTANDTAIVGDTVFCLDGGYDDSGDTTWIEGFSSIEYSVVQHYCPFYFTSGYRYLPGDAGMAAGNWPPGVIGNDVSYLVNYFRGMQPACFLNGFYASADINGNCQITGSDVTALVSYFRGMGQLRYCEDYPPQWLYSDDLPSLPPSDWPGCDP